MMKILHIEDNASDVIMLASLLDSEKRWIKEICAVSRLSAGMSILRKQHFDIVLLDLGLPDSDGEDTFINLYMEFSKIPVVLMTGNENNELARKLVMIGAQDYLIKGQITTGSLIRTINYAIERKKIFEELSFALERAKESDRLKTVFLASVSHELRTPLNAIIGFSDLMLSMETSDQISSFSKYINHSGLHLLSIIEDILNLTVIDDKNVCSTNELFLIEELIDNLDQYIVDESFAFEKSNLQIVKNFKTTTTDSEINTDKKKLEKILKILLKNAIQCTDSGEIEYGCVLKNEKEITFHVKDTGIGIHKDNHKIVFDHFRAVDESFSRKYGGFGLGLTLAKKLVESLGGNIWLESDLGKGSNFYFTILSSCKPREKKSTIQKEELEKTGLIGKTVLIVEDEETNYLFLKTLLEKNKAITLWAKNGLEAVELCRSNKDISLILMDLKMPAMDGLTAAKIIREFSPNIPIIAQTAFGLEPGLLKPNNEVFNDCIFKPIRQRDLFNIIYNCI